MRISGPPKYTMSVGVRDLVDFVLRRGGLAGTGDFFSPRRASEGTRGHQRVQRTRPAGYEAEAPLAWATECATFRLEVQGRVDGLFASGEPPWVEEIKTVRAGWDGVPDPLHWAQARFYAWMYAAREGRPVVRAQLTYLELESGIERSFSEVGDRASLDEFCRPVLASFVDWLERVVRWRVARDQSIEALEFPFGAYRPGQRQLMVAVYRTLAQRRKLFAEAATGTGKTISVLFPALKAMGAGLVERAFYLTAKGSGGAAAEGALEHLRAQGLNLRSVALCAREKLCLAGGDPCDPQQCPYAQGYYDRRRPALEAALEQGALTRTALQDWGERFRVCPHQLALDCSEWADLVIGDYNYALDPRVYLRRHFEEGNGEFALLIDEAHNLVERAREMFSAELTVREFTETRASLGRAVPSCAKLLRKITLELERLTASAPPIEGAPGALEPLFTRLERFVQTSEEWLARNEPALFREQLIGCYFQAARFLQVGSVFDQRYRLICEGEGQAGRIRLFCLDPSEPLREALGRGRSAVLFSATLSPLDYFRRILGGSPEEPVLCLDSPFPRERLGVFVHEGISTLYAERHASAREVAQAIAIFTRTRPGNQLVFFPSFDYLERVLPLFQELEPSARTIVQTPGMSPAGRERFLSEFAGAPGREVIGFVVMGGSFGEGIDLAGERLSGAVIVGVGLPPVTLERELIRAFFDQQGGLGFEFAFAFPGFNRVCQAAGRVIRSETDRGAVLLIDRRLAQGRYRRLFPSWWNPVRIRRTSELAGAVERFWAGLPDPAQTPGSLAGEPAPEG